MCARLNLVTLLSDVDLTMAKYSFTWLRHGASWTPIDYLGITNIIQHRESATTTPCCYENQHLLNKTTQSEVRCKKKKVARITLHLINLNTTLHL